MIDPTDSQLSSPSRLWLPREVQGIRDSHRCFCVVHELGIACESRDPDWIEEAQSAFDLHSSDCGACWENLLLEAERSVDPLRREAFVSLHLLAQLAVMKARGGDYRIRMDASMTATWFRYPPDFSAVVREGLHVQMGGQQLLILDVPAESDLEHPEVFVQYLDVLNVEHLQLFERLGGGETRWWGVVADEPTLLVLRCGEAISQIAGDATLFGRYQKLLTALSVSADDSNAADSFGMAFENLYELALRYDGRSNFAGYLNQSLRYRRVDRYRKEARWRSHLDQSAEPVDLDALELPAAQLSVRHFEQQQHLESVLGRILPTLTQIQRRILDEIIRTPDATAKQIAARCGVSREYVSRTRQAIRSRRSPDSR